MATVPQHCFCIEFRPTSYELGEDLPVFSAGQEFDPGDGMSTFVFIEPGGGEFCLQMFPKQGDKNNDVQHLLFNWGGNLIHIRRPYRQTEGYTECLKNLKRFYLRYSAWQRFTQYHR